MNIKNRNNGGIFVSNDVIANVSVSLRTALFTRRYY